MGDLRKSQDFLSLPLHHANDGKLHTLCSFRFFFGIKLDDKRHVEIDMSKLLIMLRRKASFSFSSRCK